MASAFWADAASVPSAYTCPLQSRREDDHVVEVSANQSQVLAALRCVLALC
jgi:hypothetical protein